MSAEDARANRQVVTGTIRGGKGSSAKGGGASVNNGIMARVTQGVRYVISGVKPDDWFGPLQPILPVAQEVKGRQFDYQVASNINYVPGQQEKWIGFGELRALADNYDLLRIGIETRKDQITRLKWQIKPVDAKDKTQDDLIKSLTEFFNFPDKQHSWSTWLRAILEDSIVIDAPCIYPRLTAQNQLYSLELLDGATIKVLINDDGRTPLAPSPAYQQILHGVPAVDYSYDELIYAPRNVRTNKMYGMGVVEQIITTINIALRRQNSQLEYYTSGSVPDAFMSVPESWNPDQISQFQTYFDSLLSGNLAERRKVRFMPGGTTYTATKENPLKDDYDEWLARIVSYALSISPQALSKQMNRATAEQAQESSEQEGLGPYKEWIAGLINLIIVKYFGVSAVEFCWREDSEQDALKQAQINDMYIKNGTKSVDEVRAELGMLPVGMPNAVYTPAGVMFVKDLISEDYQVPATCTDDHSKEGDQKLLENKPKESEGTAKIEKAAKKKSVLKPINRDRAIVSRHIIRMRRYFTRFFKQQAKDIAAQVISLISKADESSQQKAKRILDEIDLNGWAIVAGDIEPILQSMAADGARLGVLQLTSKPTGDLTNTVDERTVEWARSRSAELVGMKRVDNELVENPSARWAITDSTRDMLQSTVTQAIEEGWSNNHLAEVLEDSYSFSAARADAIARTEIKRADSQGTLEAWKATGKVKTKYSDLSSDHDHDDECDDNADAGEIPIDEAFPSGDMAPPYHPNCNCVIVEGEIEGIDDDTDQVTEETGDE